MFLIISWQYQTLETQRKIKMQFEQLHQALWNEELVRTESVKKDEEKKIAAIKEKMNELSAEMISVTETMSAIERQLKDDDMIILKVQASQFNTLTEVQNKQTEFKCVFLSFRILKLLKKGKLLIF